MGEHANRSIDSEKLFALVEVDTMLTSEITLPNITSAYAQTTGPTRNIFVPPAVSGVVAPALPFFTAPYNRYPHISTRYTDFYYNSNDIFDSYQCVYQVSSKDATTATGPGVDSMYSGGVATVDLMPNLELNPSIQHMLNSQLACYRIDVCIEVWTDERITPDIAVCNCVTNPCVDDDFTSSQRIIGTSFLSTDPVVNKLYPDVVKFHKRRMCAVLSRPLERCYIRRNANISGNQGMWSVGVAINNTRVVPDPRGLTFVVVFPGYQMSVSDCKALYASVIGVTPVDGVAYVVGKMMVKTKSYYAVVGQDTGTDFSGLFLEKAAMNLLRQEQRLRVGCYIEETHEHDADENLEW